MHLYFASWLIILLDTTADNIEKICTFPVPEFTTINL